MAAIIRLIGKWRKILNCDYFLLNNNIKHFIILNESIFIGGTSNCCRLR